MNSLLAKSAGCGARALGLTFAGCVLPLVVFASIPQVTFTPFHADGIYRLGEKVGWTVAAPPGAPIPRGRFSYTIKRNDLDVVSTGSFSLATGKATISTTFEAPAMLYVVVDYEPTLSAISRGDYQTLNRALKALLIKTDPSLRQLFARYPRYQPLAPQFPIGWFAEHRVATLGAAVAPTLLRPAVPPPRNFLAFWKGKLTALAKVPMRATLAPLRTAQAGVRLFRIRITSIGSGLEGYLAMPEHPGKFPALIIYRHSGAYPRQSTRATNRAAEGWLTLVVDTQGLNRRRRTDAARNVARIGDHSPDTSYFLDMYLRDTRALQYIRHSSHWNGKTVVLTGVGIGGQQSLATAGLNSGKVSAVIVDEPSGTDMNGLAHGRRPGYPYYGTTNRTVLRAAAYFDPINFAPHITAPTLIAMGFIDTAAPPVGIWTVLNEIPAPTEAVPLVNSAHMTRTPDEQAPWSERSEEVLAQLAHGGIFTPNQALTRPATRHVR